MRYGGRGCGEVWKSQNHIDPIPKYGILYFKELTHLPQGFLVAWSVNGHSREIGVSVSIEDPTEIITLR